MIAPWMLYCLLCALGLTAAAVLAERALLRGRGPVRVVWIGAVLLSLLVPATALRFARRPAAANPVAMSSGEAAAEQSATSFTEPTNISRPPQVTPQPGNWRATLERWDETLVVAWITLSVAVGINFFGGVLVLAWMRRRWQRRNVLGVSVYISERTGPAVVGALSPAIVVPEWVLALEPAQLSLMLRHEQEHRLAGDGRLLTVAQLALVALPWNLALWWQIFRLRVAVELDCDARVLREVDARSYGDLLLEFARPRRGPNLLGVTAFAERAAQLERRIRLLARHRVHTPRAARALATCIGIAALTGAWVAPRPPVPVRAGVQVPADRVVPAPLTVPAINPSVVPKAPEKSEPQTSRRVVNRPSPAPRSTAPPCGGAAGRVNARLTDSIFDRLFEGITLAARQADRACALLAKLEDQQIAEDNAAPVRFAENQARTLALRTQRDSALRALLTSDADRATFDVRLIQSPMGGRGRGGGVGADSAASGRRAGGGGVGMGARSGGGGRGGRGGQAGQPPDWSTDVSSVFTDVSNVINDLMFRRLFEGMALTTGQEANARALIAETQEEIRLQNRPRPAVLRLDHVNGLVSMSEASAAELGALLSSDADRATMQARIVSVRPR